MTTFLKQLLIGGLVLSLSGAVLAEKTGYYRWIDDEGRPQYTQRPPENRDYQFIPTHGGQSFGSDSEAAQAAAETAAAPEAAQGDLSGEMEVLPEQDPERCSQAKANLEALSGNIRVRMTDPDGNQRFLTEEEKEAQRARAREVIDVHCP